MYCFKYHFLLLFLFVGILALNCSQKEFEKVLVFGSNLTETREPELVCRLSEEEVFLSEIKDFTFLNDTSFVVIDGRGAYLYNISGVFVSQFGNIGKAGGEMLSPSSIYATSDFVYIWCSTLMKILIFDKEANFKEEISGFERATKKFVADINNEIIYLYTSGLYNADNDKMLNVIDIYNIAKSATQSIGERNSEDEITSSFVNSGGLYADRDRFVYLHPANLIIYNFELSTGSEVRYKINDKAFRTEKIANIHDLMNDRRKFTDFFTKNSVVRGLYKDNNHFIIVSEVGQFDYNEQRGFDKTQKTEKSNSIF